MIHFQDRSSTVINAKWAFFLWTKALSNMFLVEAQELSGIVSLSASFRLQEMILHNPCGGVYLHFCKWLYSLTWECQSLLHDCCMWKVMTAEAVVAFPSSWLSFERGLLPFCMPWLTARCQVRRSSVQFSHVLMLMLHSFMSFLQTTLKRRRGCPVGHESSASSVDIALY